MDSLIRPLLVGLLCFALLTSPLQADEPANTVKSISAKEGRMAWWREARLGMFVHWGLYAIPAGEWNGEEVPGIGEWIMHRANIPVDDYKLLAEQFDPVDYDPVEWVRIAKEAGMKYIVITSKHHDGFCLFDTAATDWDVVDATPYGKDLLAPLSAECKQQGLKFCTYYSIMDWHHPTQGRDIEKGYNPTTIKQGRKEEYIKYMKQQLRELLDSCDPDVLWFDGEWVSWWTEEDGKEMYAYLRGLKPSLIINNRVGKGRKGMEGLNKDDQEYAGDFGTPEQQIPETGLPGIDWETCMTMNDTWGYKHGDQNWKSTKTLLRQTIDIVSKGGNFLLNVGPMAEGKIPQESIELLAGMGVWMKKNGESIYGATASPVEAPSWGRYTTKHVEDMQILYAHVFDWPDEGTITVPWPHEAPALCTMLEGKRPLSTERNQQTLVIELPPTQPDSVATVIRIEPITD